MKTYKLRAECTEDLLNFAAKSNGKITNFKYNKWDDMPDADLEFKTDLSLDEIRNILFNINDGHVMWQTVKPVEEYDEERAYEINPPEGTML